MIEIFPQVEWNVLQKFLVIHSKLGESLHHLFPLWLYLDSKLCFVRQHRVFLAGQSAGSHLAACALVKQAQKEVLDGPSNLSWSSRQLRGFIAISGG
jgi:hypothetical protein